MITLLILLNVCHWLADYSHLSTKWMLDAKRIGSPWFPIYCHVLVHGFLMGAVLAFFLPLFGWLWILLIAFQVTTHFWIDVLKGKLNVWFPNVSNPANKSHWYIFGADQLLHQVVIITMVAIINQFGII